MKAKLSKLYNLFTTWNTMHPTVQPKRTFFHAQLSKWIVKPTIRQPSRKMSSMTGRGSTTQRAEVWLAKAAANKVRPARAPSQVRIKFKTCGMRAIECSSSQRVCIQLEHNALVGEILQPHHQPSVVRPAFVCRRLCFIMHDPTFSTRQPVVKHLLSELSWMDEALNSCSGRAGGDR